MDRVVPRKREERINEEIRVPNVRLVDENGGQVGITATKEALEFAYGKGLDLVEVAAGADPPRGSWTRSTATSRNSARSRPASTSSRSTSRRSSSGRRSETTTTRPRKARRALSRAASQVKVTIMFRGRETLHPERGRDLLMRLAEDVKELGSIEQPVLDGRNMVMVLGPNKNVGVKTDAKDEDVKGAKKRFKVTGAGKLLRRHGMRSHNLEKKSSKRRRGFRKETASPGAT